MEDVWLYPRPPAIERARRIRIVLAGITIAETDQAWRVMETSHPPSYYLPPDAFRDCTIEPASGSSVCEWKGRARYHSIRAGHVTVDHAAWSYPEPEPPYEALRDHLAVYAGLMEACFVGDDRVTPQPGGFYGGWITPDLKGPFKGVPGSLGW